MGHSQIIVPLIRKGVSINKIKEKTGLAKSTIYYHYQKTLGRKIPLLAINFTSKNDLGEFLGVFAGDGYMNKRENYHYLTSICIGYYEKDYAEYLLRKCEFWFGKKPMVSHMLHKSKPTAVVLFYYSKAIHNLIKEYLTWSGVKTYSVRLKNFDPRDRDFNIGFLRGLIDTDGSYFAPKRKVSFSSTSKALAMQAYQIIKYNLNLEPHWMEYKKENRALLYTITLHGRNTKKLMDAVRLGNPHKIMR